MQKHFDILSNINRNDVVQHPAYNTIHNLYCHRSYTSIHICSVIDQDGNEQRDYTFFYCSQCQKWLKMSNTVGNVQSHIKALHPNLLPIPDSPSLTPKEVIRNAQKFILLNGLPFSYVEDKYFSALCPGIGSRKKISILCEQKAKIVKEEIKRQLRSASNIWLTFDEWTDPQMQSYLGITVLCMIGNNYLSFCISHKPLITQEKESGFLASVINEALDFYSIEGKVNGCVTDNASVMKATARALNIPWHPCFCHLINLIVGDFINAAHANIDYLSTLQKTLCASTKWISYLQSCKSPLLSLPSYTVTRWYSIYNLLKNAITLQPFIESFAIEQGWSTEIPYGFFQRLEEIINVIATARNAIMQLESDSFGTISKVIDCFRMIYKSVEDLDEDIWKYEIDVFKKSYNKHFEKVFEQYYDTLLICARLNPQSITSTSLTSKEQAQADKLLIDLENKNDSPSSSQDTSPKKKEGKYGISFKDFLSLKRTVTTCSEHAQYLSLARGRHDSDDILEFWLLNMSTLPKLTAIAFQYLSSPASNTASERGFSKAKKIVIPHRIALKKSKVEDSIIIACNKAISETIL